MKNDHTTDELFMKRAFQLAALGKGHVSPNPLVGSVVVHDNLIIGEGWHRQYGGPHAEVNAINSIQDKTKLGESTVYVTLEPCSHFGKTPPCADMLISSKVKRVVIANIDSNPLVAGQGIRKLREAGIEVITGILEREGRELNKRFFTFMEKKRPYIILKWAQTRDGFVARENMESKWISNPSSRQLVHKWRAEEDAILVGFRTAMHDNPELSVREWTGRSPVRIVLDKFLKLNTRLKLFDQRQKTLCFNVMRHEEKKNLSLIRVDEEGFLQNVIDALFKLKVQSIIIEGGANTLNQFIDSGLWDEARIFTGQRVFDKGIAAPAAPGILREQHVIAGDVLEYRFKEQARF